MANKFPRKEQALKNLKEYQEKYTVSAAQAENYKKQILDFKEKTHMLQTKSELLKKSIQYYTQVILGLEKKIDNCAQSLNRVDLVRTCNSQNFNKLKIELKSAVPVCVEGDQGTTQISAMDTDNELSIEKMKMYEEDILMNNEVIKHMIQDLYQLNI